MCNDTLTTFTLKESILQSLISTQLQLLSYENPSLYVVENLVSSLFSLTGNVYEINPASALLSIKILDSIMRRFQVYPLPSSFLSIILQIVENIALSQLVDTTLSRHTNMLPADKFSPDGYVSSQTLTLETLNNVAISFAAQMVPGQHELTVKTLFHAMSIIDVSRSDLYRPLALRGLDGSNFSISLSENLQVPDIKLACDFIKTRLFGNLSVSLLSYPAHVITSLEPYEIALTNISVDFKHVRYFQQLPSVFPVSLDFDQELVRTRCYDNLVAKSTFHCANGYKIPILCNGSDAVITSFCAFAYENVKCGIISTHESVLASDSYNNCTITEWSANSSSCVCYGKNFPPKSLPSGHTSFDIISFTFFCTDSIFL
jgi:hypothetical protein